MTNEEKLERLEALEAAADELVSALRYAKVVARMLVAGKTPKKSTLHGKVGEAIGRWDALIDLEPRDTFFDIVS